MSEDEKYEYEFGAKRKLKDEKKLVTEITSENNEIYFLYDDGNLYKKDSSGKLIKLENITPESKELIKKLMNKFKPGRTDVKISEFDKKENEMELPEL